MAANRSSFSQGAAVLVLLCDAGCHSRQNQDARIEEMQSQLEETKKELQAMKDKADEQKAKSDQSRSGGPAQANHPDTVPKKRHTGPERGRG